MNTGEAVEVRYDRSFLRVEYHKLIGVHVGDVEPPLRRVEALVVEADRRLPATEHPPLSLGEPDPSFERRTAGMTRTKRESQHRQRQNTAHSVSWITHRRLLYNLSSGYLQARRSSIVRRRCREHSANLSRHMSALIRVVFAFLVICALGEDTLAQTTGRASQTTSDQTVRGAQAVRVERSPRLDGTLDDPIWQQAVPITDFRQKEPYEGQPATEKTEVRILYTRTEVYFGVVCQGFSRPRTCCNSATPGRDSGTR